MVGTSTKPYNMVPTDSYSILTALMTQPNAVAVQADSLIFQTYQSGVLTSYRCGTDVNHALLAVGFNTETSPPYLIVRNWWGTGWGEQGNILIGMSGGKGVCGIN